MAGTAGALSAQTTRFVGLNTLGILISGIAVVMLVLGGTRRLYGAFLGAAIYVVVQDYAAKVNPFYWMFVIGALLMATVLFLENGLMGLRSISARDNLRRMLRRPTRAMSDDPSCRCAACARVSARWRSRNRSISTCGAGARVGLIGPNGAGKTTFVNLLTGVLQAGRRLDPARRRDRSTHAAGAARAARARAHAPDQHTADGDDGARQCRHRHRRARENRLAHDALTASNGGAARRGRCAARRHRHCRVADRRVSQLPYGQQRLLEIAIALALKPRVLLLDEPAAGVPAAEAHVIHDVLDICRPTSRS